MIEIPEVIKSYIDGLDDEGRDRIIAGALNGCSQSDGRTAGCIMQLAERSEELYDRKWAERTKRPIEYAINIFGAYDALIFKHGPQATASAIKAYAARNNRIDTTNSVSRTHDSVVTEQA